MNLCSFVCVSLSLLACLPACHPAQTCNLKFRTYMYSLILYFLCTLRATYRHVRMYTHRYIMLLYFKHHSPASQPAEASQSVNSESTHPAIPSSSKILISWNGGTKKEKHFLFVAFFWWVGVSKVQNKTELKQEKIRNRNMNLFIFFNIPFRSVKCTVVFCFEIWFIIFSQNQDSHTLFGFH